MKVVLVYNSGSGGNFSLADLRKQFAKRSIEIQDAIPIGPGFEKLLRRHIEQKEIIAVVGGDGSISTVANLLSGTEAVLMPLPGGTLNHFTKDLGVPQSLPEALEYFGAAHATRIDAGRVNGKIFVNNSSMGIYSDSLVDRDGHEERYGKLPAIFISALKTLFRFRSYTVRLNGKTYSTPLVFIGNNRYEPEGLVFRRSQLNAGVLSVFMVIGASRLGLFRAALNLALGQKNVAETLKAFTADSVTLTTHGPVRISRDGEHEKMPSPLKYEVAKAALYVLRR